MFRKPLTNFAALHSMTLKMMILMIISLMIKGLHFLSFHIICITSTFFFVFLLYILTILNDEDPLQLSMLILSTFLLRQKGGEHMKSFLFVVCSLHALFALRQK